MGVPPAYGDPYGATPTGYALFPQASNACYIGPLRNLNGTASNRMYYDATTHELTFGTETSSRRYKTDIVPLQPQRAEDLLTRMNPVEYRDINTDKRGFGFIAEDVVDIFPEIIIYNPIEPTKIEGIEYEKLVAPLVQVVQNQQRSLAKLQASYDILQASHETLQSSHETLQASHDILQSSHDMLQSSHETTLSVVEMMRTELDELKKRV